MPEFQFSDWWFFSLRLPTILLSYQCRLTSMIMIMDYAEFIVNVGLVRQSMYFMRTYENNHDVDRKESI